jgi:macrolide transport system ATP-binding/permease protein
MHNEDPAKGGFYMAMLLSIRNIKKDFAVKKILKGISFDISTGDRIGIVGLNGAGKTTLVNIITGNLPYDEGSLVWHKKSVNIGYLKQDSAFIKSINCEENPESFLKYSSSLGLKKVHRWKGEKLNNLSGGERTKIALSQIWSADPDFLILDEPTNHLDYSGIQWLIKEIGGYKGTVIIISHDRYFLDKCVNRILEIDDGNMIQYNGN